MIQAMLAQATPPAAHDATLSGVIAPYMAVFFVAFFVAFAATPVMRRLALRNGVVDWPDLRRKAHLQPIPYLGGVGIFLGWLAGVSLCYLSVRTNNDILGPQLANAGFPISIVVGAAAITITGLFDDVYGISPRVKIGGQLFAAAAIATEQLGQHLVDNSLRLVGLHLPEPLVYVLGTILVAAFVIGGCNAVNLLDGLDGLASGVVAVAAVGFLIIAAIVTLQHLQDAGTTYAHLHGIGYPNRIILCLALIGALLGFLPYNFNPASIFMGDAGSLLLGFLSVCAILMFSLVGPRSLLLVTAALVVFALPLTDTSLAIIRRKRAGQPIFSADNKHLHHLLRRTGLSVRQSVLVMYAASATFAALGITMVAMEWRWRYILAVFVVIYCTIMVTGYKYGVRLALAEKRQAEEAAVRQPPVLPPTAVISPLPRREIPSPTNN